MNRTYLFATLLAALAGMTVNAFAAANTTGSDRMSEILKSKALHIFNISDKDHDHTLDRLEQEYSARQAYRIIKEMSADNVLGGRRVPPAVAEPRLLDPDSVTADEFVEFFLFRAAQYDAQIRGMRIVRATQSMPPFTQYAVMAAVRSNRTRNISLPPVQHIHLHHGIGHHHHR